MINTIIRYNDKHQIHCIKHFANGCFHNSYGAAGTWWNEDGMIMFELYCIDGGLVDETDHPFTIFRKEHNLGKYGDWSEDMKVAFRSPYLQLFPL